jgi:hypothetical protein
MTDDQFLTDVVCDEFVLDTDDKEEVYEGDEEYDNVDGYEDDGGEADDEGVEPDDEDAESPDTPVVDKIDPELQYEICATALGDCGCVTGADDAVKRRYV